jgi:predicted nuclease with TOPRIM domain
MGSQRFYAEIKYILTVGVALAGAAVVVNQELTNSKFEGVSTKIEGVSTRIEGVSIEVARLGQRVDRMEQKFENMEKRMDEKFARMEKKIDELLIQQSVPNFWPWSQWRR